MSSFFMTKKVIKTVIAFILDLYIIANQQLM